VRAGLPREMLEPAATGHSARRVPSPGVAPSAIVHGATSLRESTDRRLPASPGRSGEPPTAESAAFHATRPARIAAQSCRFAAERHLSLASSARRPRSLTPTAKLAAGLRARGGVMSDLLLDAAGRPRSPATMPGFHTGRPPRNKGQRDPADPPTGRGDCCGHARHRRRAPCTSAARPDRCAVAGRAADVPCDADRRLLAADVVVDIIVPGVYYVAIAYFCLLGRTR
jgi:hypothetical protein